MSLPVTKPETVRRTPLQSRKDTSMYAIELRLIEARERQQLLLDFREHRQAGRRARSLRRRLGGSLMRLGQRIGGDPMTTPAWQG